MEILEYDESLLMDQVKFVNKLQKTWKPTEFKQTVKFYKKSFSGNSFAKNLNLYAYRDKELVGVLNSRLSKKNGLVTIEVLTHEIPIVRELFNKFISNLLEPDIATVIMLAGEARGNSLQITNNLGFSKESPHLKFAEQPLNSIKIRGTCLDLTNYNPERDFTQISDIQEREYGIPRDAITHELEDMYRLQPLILSWKVIIENGQIVAFSLLIVDEPGSKLAFIRDLYLGPSEKNREEYFQRLMRCNMKAAEENNIETISVRMYRPQLELEKLYSNVGFNFYSIDKYTRPIK